MQYKIESFDPKTVPDEFWEPYFEFTETKFKEENPGDPLPDREGVIQCQKTDIPHFGVKRWLVYDDNGMVIGWAGFGAVRESSPEFETSGHTVGISITVHPDFRRQGIGTELLKILVSETETYGRSVIQLGADTESGKAFLSKHGATIAIEGAENRLLMSDIDWDLMDKWVADGKRRTEGLVALQTFFDCPKDILADYVNIYSTTMNQQPMGEIEGEARITPELRREYEARNKELGRINFTMITREADGTISGLTEFFYDPKDGHFMAQGLTGVDEIFRGRGLGKWLKAAMVMHIRDNFPEVARISTGNADENAPMMSINDRMGFKRHKAGAVYKFKTEELKEKLGMTVS